MMKLNLLQMTYYQRSPLGKPLPALAMLRTESWCGERETEGKTPKQGMCHPPAGRVVRGRGGDRRLEGSGLSQRGQVQPSQESLSLTFWACSFFPFFFFSFAFSFFPSYSYFISVFCLPLNEA